MKKKAVKTTNKKTQGSNQKDFYYIDSDEYYPFWFLVKVEGGMRKTAGCVHIPKAKLAWIRRTMREFEKTQDYLNAHNDNLIDLEIKRKESKRKESKRNVPAR